MDVIIYPLRVQGQLYHKRARAYNIQEWSLDRRNRADEFASDSSLEGETWDSARNRLSKYSTLFSCMSYTASNSAEADQRVLNALKKFGCSHYINEADFRKLRDEAVKKENDYRAKAASIKKNQTDIFHLQERYYRQQCQNWRTRKNEAQKMLDKIDQYKRETSNTYNGVSQQIAVMNNGVRLLTKNRYQSNSLLWPDINVKWNKWLDSMRGTTPEIAKSKEHLFTAKGSLDENKVRKLLEKPYELWTPEEAAALAETYEACCEDATNGNSENLNKLINCAYILSSCTVHNGSRNGRSDDRFGYVNYTATYTMSEGFELILLYEKKRLENEAFEKTGNLTSAEYLMAGISVGLLGGGRTIDVSGTANYNRSNAMLLEKDDKYGKINLPMADTRDKPDDFTMNAVYDSLTNPGVEIKPRQSKTYKGEDGSEKSVTYDDIILGAKPYDDAKLTDPTSFIDRRHEHEKNKHIYILRDGRPIENIDDIERLDAAFDLEDKTEDAKVENVVGNALVDKVVGKAFDTVKDTATEAAGGGSVKTVVSVFEFIYDTAYDYSEAQEELESAKDALYFADEKKEWSADLDARGIDNGIVIYNPDDNGVYVSCLGYDDTYRGQTGDMRRQYYLENYASYEQYRAGDISAKPIDTTSEVVGNPDTCDLSYHAWYNFYHK